MRLSRWVLTLVNRLGVSGAIVWAIALPWWIVSIGGGFAVAGLVTVRLPDSTIDLIVLCAVTAAGTGALRTYFGEFE